MLFRSVKEIVAEKGWDGFRREERIVIKGLSFMAGSVIALGGGAVMDPENLQILNGKGIFIWLDADAETIIGRMQKDSATSEQRPTLTNADPLTETAAMLKEREPIYRLLANNIVNTTGRTVEAVVDEIIRLIAEG